MTMNEFKIHFFREQIPAFSCTPGCHDCCGPVTASSEEVAQLPIKSEAEHAIALADLSCPYLGENGCEVYDDRPLICRLYGTTPSMLCPHGQKPEQMIDSRIEQKIHDFHAQTRQVLL